MSPHPAKRAAQFGQAVMRMAMAMGDNHPLWTPGEYPVQRVARLFPAEEK